MPQRRYLQLLLGVLLAASVPLSQAQAQTERKAELAEAKAQFKKGRQFLKAGEYGKAVVAFDQAYTITGDGLVKGQTALAYEQAGDYEGALAAFKIYRDALPQSKREGAEIKIKKCEKMIARGKTQKLVLPGAAGAKPAEGTDKPAEGTDTPAETTDKPAETTDTPAEGTDKPAETTDKPAETTDTPSEGTTDEPAGEEPGSLAEATEGKRFYTWIAAGGAAALALSGLVVGLNAQAKYDELEENCAPVCSQDRVDSVKTRALVADVLLGVAAGAAVTAGVLYFLEGRGGEEKAASREQGRRTATRRLNVTPVAGGGTFGLSADIKF